MTAARSLCQVLLAPFSGKTVELASVPDPVFAEKLTGDGLAIELSSDTVLAPCDGVISLFFDTKHAFAITTDDGIQILVHVGLDSIILNGEGLTALKKSGDRVKAGTPIIKVLKSNEIKNPQSEVDAVTGATLTSNGVSDMLQDGFKKYNAALKK